MTFRCSDLIVQSSECDDLKQVNFRSFYAILVYHQEYDLLCLLLNFDFLIMVYLYLKALAELCYFYDVSVDHGDVFFLCFFEGD